MGTFDRRSNVQLVILVETGHGAKVMEELSRVRRGEGSEKREETELPFLDHNLV